MAITFDPGAPPSAVFDKGPLVELARHFATVPSYQTATADHRDLFWWDWGPVFYRGRLNKTAQGDRDRQRPRAHRTPRRPHPRRRRRPTRPRTADQDRTDPRLRPGQRLRPTPSTPSRYPTHSPCSLTPTS